MSTTSPAQTADGPSPRGAVGAVLLAAGRGSRMGDKPKCLLELDGVALVRRQAMALLAAGADPVVVVLGHHAQAIEPALHGLAVTLVHNPSPDDGPISSQRLGLAALPDAPDSVLVALADQPLVNDQDIRVLVQAFQRQRIGAQALVPRVAGQRGNPVVFSNAVRLAILASAPSVGCRQWQADNASAVTFYDSDNLHYRWDVDSPEDIARLAQQTGHTLTWPAALNGP